MTWTVAQMWRHPIKGIGAEALETVDVTADLPFPLDRAWAVLEDGGDESDGWRSCRNFLRGAKGPALMGVKARTTDSGIELSHPKAATHVVDPTSANQDDFFAWLANIYPAERRAPVRLVKAPDSGMADVPFASVSILNLSSLRALSQKAGQTLNPRRFRGNIWIEGLAPWEEFDLVGKSLTIGNAVLNIAEPITRCRATEANPETGFRDISTLQLLEQGWGHTDFGVNATVATGGTINIGDTVRIT